MSANWRGWVGGILLMFAGGALALAGEHVLLLHHPGHGASNGVPSADAIVATLDAQLHLTRAQHDSIEQVLSRHRTEIDSAWKAIHMQLSTSMDSVHREIGRILTKEQTQQFHSWLREQHHF